jgi:transcriptional regulator with XRE-family HTH domain
MQAASFASMNAKALVARNVRKLRVKRGLSQENLAVDARISTVYLNAIERGVKNPTVDVLERLAIALDVKIVDFFATPLASEKPPCPLPGGRRPKR